MTSRLMSSLFSPLFPTLALERHQFRGLIWGRPQQQLQARPVCVRHVPRASGALVREVLVMQWLHEITTKIPDLDRQVV